jgi:hypothetical protein
LLGGIWRQESYDVLEIVALYLLVGTSVVIVSMVTPNQAEYIKGLLRARKQGQSHLSSWHDLSLNRVFLAILCAILLVTGTIIWSAGINLPTALPAQTVTNYPLGVAMSVLVVAYFGLGLQYFHLGFGVRGRMYFGLFLFLAWILPMVAGTIFMFSARPFEQNHAGQVIYSLSPIAGIATCSAGGSDRFYAKVMQGAAITPALLFAFVFNSLLIAARRRVYKAFQARPEVAKPISNDQVGLVLDPAAS